MQRPNTVPLNRRHLQDERLGQIIRFRPTVPAGIDLPVIAHDHQRIFGEIQLGADHLDHRIHPRRGFRPRFAVLTAEDVPTNATFTDNGDGTVTDNVTGLT